MYHLISGRPAFYTAILTLAAHASPLFAVDYQPYVFFGPTIDAYPSPGVTVRGGITDALGNIAASSRIFDLSSNSWHEIPWIASPQSQTPITLGLTDPMHFDASTLISYSSLLARNGTFYFGLTNRYSGSTYLGNDGWVYNAADNSTVMLHFADGTPYHVDAFGFMLRKTDNALPEIGNRLVFRNTAWLDPATGVVEPITFSDPLNVISNPVFATYAFSVGTQSFLQGRGGANGRNTAEVLRVDASGASLGLLGIFDTLHTGSSGQRGDFAPFHQGIYVVGWSQRYAENTTLGSDPWVFNTQTNTLTPIVLTDAEHVSADGTRSGSVSLVTPTGIALGYAAIGGNIAQGYDQYVFDLNTNTLTFIGPRDAAHTRSDGYRAIDGRINSQYAVGNARAYNTASSAFDSRDAWIENLQTHQVTLLPGLTGAGYTASDGSHLSGATFLNDRLLSGFSQRYDLSTSPTSVLWLYNFTSGTTTQMGVYDTKHFYTGTQDNLILFNNDKLIAGTTQYAANGYTFMGWVFDLQTLTTHATPLATIDTLLDDGTVLGSYYKSADTTFLHPYAASWSIAGGLVDLSDQYRSLLDAVGIDHLQSGSFGDDGIFRGYGTPIASPDSTVFVLFVPTPEPSSLLLLLAAAPALFLRRR
jgi:hypothetical protein